MSSRERPGVVFSLSAACCWEGPFCIWEGSRNKIAVGPKQSNQVFKTCAKTRKKAGLFLCCFLFFVLYPKPFFTEVIGLCSLLFLTMKVCCCSWWCFGFAEFCLLPNQGNNGWPGTKDEARGSRRVVGLIIWLFAGTKDTGTLANGQKTRNTHTQFLAVPQNALCTRTLPHVSNSKLQWRLVIVSTRDTVVRRALKSKIVITYRTIACSLARLKLLKWKTFA